MVDEGKRLSGTNLLSGFGEAMASPFSVVMLYLSPNPRTISCPAEAMDIPVIFFTPSSTFEIPFTLISFAPKFSMATVDFCLSICRARSPSKFFRATTVTSLNCLLSGSNMISSSVGCELSFTFISFVLKETYDIIKV